MSQYLLTQLLNGLIVGSLYILLSIGLTIIFGMLGIVNFAHGALYMLGAYAAYTVVGILSGNFLIAILVVPLAIGLIGAFLETTLLRCLYRVEPFYNLLLTFGLMLVIQDAVRIGYGPEGEPFNIPSALLGAVNIGITYYPKYRLFIFAMTVLCSIGVILFLEKTKLGAIIRAGTEDSDMVDALGIDIGKIFTLVFGIGAGLAGLAGVLAAPVQNVEPAMGMNFLVDTFVVVVVGGMGSIIGSILAGLIIGESLTIGVLIWPPMATTLIYILMAVILLIRPRGLLGRAEFLD